MHIILSTYNVLLSRHAKLPSKCNASLSEIMSILVSANTIYVFDKRKKLSLLQASYLKAAQMLTFLSLSQNNINVDPPRSTTPYPLITHLPLPYSMFPFVDQKKNKVNL